MLIRFIKEVVIIDIGGNSSGDSCSWYTEGQCIVGEIVKEDEHGVRIRSFSDDNEEFIVEKDSYEIVDKPQFWWDTEGLPKVCDICKQKLDGIFWDGKTIHGPWGFMCGKCFVTDGMGLGTGLGQRYDFDKSSGLWVKTAG